MTKTAQTIVAKALVAFVAAAMLFTMFATPAKAATSVEDLQKMINDLMAQIAALQGSSTGGTCVAIPAPLTIGAQNANVTALQNYLIAAGQVIPAGATGYFGTQTQSALAAWQAANGVSPAVGYYGPITAAAMAAKCVPADDDNDNGGSDDLEGGAGSISDADWITSLNNEEVGEDAEDVEVAGLEIEADEGSDIELTAVRLIFDEGTGAANDFEDYADEVSIWFDGEEVARVDGDVFNDDNNWSRTVTLDSGAIIRADETGELVVAISAVGNLDSEDIGDDWDVAFASVRFRDAQDAIITDSSTGDIESDGSVNRTFSFESFSTANDVELKISKGDDEINDARVINVHASQDTDDVEILSFNAEVEGDSDVLVEDVVVEFVVTGAGHLDEMATAVYLMLDGEVVGTENVPTDEETVTFDDIDVELEAGETYEFIVTADLLSTGGALDAGDTISAKVTSTELDAWNVEDESGEDLADTTEKTGSAVGEAHATYDVGFNVELVSATETKTVTSDTSGTGDQGQFVIKYEVTAFDGDIYIDDTCTEDTDDSETAGEGNSFTMTNPADNTTNCVLTSTADSATASFLVEEGTTETFTLTVNATATADDFAQMEITAIGWNTANAGGANLFTFGLEDFETDPLFLNLF